MDSEQLEKLRQLYNSLLEQQRWLDKLLEKSQGGNMINKGAIIPLLNDFSQLNNEYPSLIPAFNLDDYGGGESYNFFGIRSYLAAAIGRLQIAIEQPASNPVTEKRLFSFVNDSDLRKIIERDYDELQRAFISNCWKSVIILCGGAIETILTDLLMQNQTAAKAAKSAPKNSDIIRWDLSNLINVAVELSLVSDGVEKLSHPIREYRNLVHPGNEFRSKLRFDAEEAKIAIEVLHIVHRDLSH